ncbi:MAG: hypothetical protein WBQ78_02865 [Gammaproteobacteria bacterium]
MPSDLTKNRLSRLFFGFALPVLVEVIAAFAVIVPDSGASAEGFAGILVVIMLIVAIPITLVGNLLVLPGHMTDKFSYIFRSMILPSCFLVAILIYYTGMWDHTIRPYFPRQEENIQVAGSGPVGDGTYESIFVVNSYTGSIEEQKEIDNYARKTYTKKTWENSQYVTLDVQYYFVPRELYDPLNDALNRERAVAVFRHIGTDKSPIIEKVER